MGYRGWVWLPEDGPDKRIDATVTIESGFLAIATDTDSLGRWPIDVVEVQPETTLAISTTGGSSRTLLRVIVGR